MKKLIFPAVGIILLICSISSYAKVWRVDANSANKPDGTWLQGTINVTAAGDTIYVAGFSSTYGSININKKLVLIGTGYFLNENASMQASGLSSKIDDIIFSGGAENSEIYGFQIDHLFICCGNLIIKRNYITTNYQFPFYFQGQVNNILIEQNYIECKADAGGSYSAAIYSGIADNLIVRNNYIEAVKGTECYGIRMDGGTAFVYNNVINSNKISITNCSFYNNIFMCPEGSTVNNQIRNNICKYHPFGQVNGNKEDVDMASVFINSTSPDGRWQLKDGSPAKGAGVNGEDCGMFGGTDPYVLSGIPPIPTIYEATIPNSASEQEGLKVIIKARTNN